MSEPILILSVIVLAACALAPQLVNGTLFVIRGLRVRRVFRQHVAAFIVTLVVLLTVWAILEALA